MNPEKDRFDIICLSHLKWEKTLFQRPQQLMRQFSGDSKILFLAHCPLREFLRAIFRGQLGEYIGRHNDNLQYMTLPYFPLTRKFKFFQNLTYLLTAFVARSKVKRLGFRNIILWMYYPTFTNNLKKFPHEKLVYDCMDLFRGFKASSTDVQEQENRLLQNADIVFTGGKSLQKSKQGINPRTYCFPSGVEFGHFSKATLDETSIPEDIKNIPHPILGYFGAVDERIDYDLVNHICQKRPDWSVVFLGPLVMRSEVPVHHPNFHYLGKKDYALLPNYLKAFDVCLMPFVISELTLHISPTKTPEYLSGGKPVVSTAIPDVIADYSDVVEIAGDYEEFIRKTENVLKDAPEDLHTRIRKKAETKSWEYISKEMIRLIFET